MKLAGSLALSTVLALVLGCGGDGSSTGTCDGVAPYVVSGPHVAGVTTFMRADVPVEVWYPADPGAEVGLAPDVYDLRDWMPADMAAAILDADAPLHTTTAYRDLPASASRFPVVLFSHGLGGYRSQSTFLMAHLATWGFVVVAPEHPERGLAAVLGNQQLGDDSAAALLDALEMLKGEDVAAGGRLEGRLDFDHVAVSGHSMGGGATMVDAPDPQIHAWFTLATVAAGSAPGKPSLMMAGIEDNVAVIDQTREEYGRKAAPKRFAAIARAGHLGFTDICAISRDDGGLFGLAQKYGIEINDMLVTIGTDGCGADNLPAEEGWPVISHFVTAHLRAAFAIDAAPTGLDQAAADCFAGRVAEYEQE
jgi:dienelactone hydrolase